MAEDEKISIVTISYNSEKMIEKIFQSILSQSYRPLGYVLVDGSSTDGTVDHKKLCRQGVLNMFLPLSIL